MNEDQDVPASVDVAVVGAGFAGLYTLHLMRERGLSCHVFEAGGDVGGTWYWNRYPGARCDVESVESVESVDYCYSFSEDVHREWTWSERFATQPEILRYAEFVADRFELRRDISFDAQVTSVDWDDDSTSWTLATRDGRGTRARFVIAAVGLLSASNTPRVPGLERFAGRIVHTGHWPHEGVDFSGRRVAVIGTGSSGVQLIPEIAAEAAHTTVFQRTPNYVLPARNRPLTAREVLHAQEDREFIRRQATVTPAGYYTAGTGRAVFDDTPEQRRTELERRWQAGGTEFVGTYTDVATSREANEVVAEFVREKIREAVHDPDTAAKLEPRDHPIASKRPTVGTGYYETFNRDDVELVDVRTEPIVEITAGGVRVEAGEYEVDDLVLATGYDAMTGPLTRMGIRGRHGASLTEAWADGPRSYLGLATAGFPNLFTVTGPLSATALTNVMRSIEHHVEWIADCLVELSRRGVATIEADTTAQDEWDRQVAMVGGYTFYPEVASWYTGGNIEGKARKLMMWVGGLNTYQQICSYIADGGYIGFRLDDAEPVQPPTGGPDEQGTLPRPTPTDADLTAAAATP